MPAFEQARAIPRPMQSAAAVMYAVLPATSFNGGGCGTFGGGGMLGPRRGPAAPALEGSLVAPAFAPPPPAFCAATRLDPSPVTSAAIPALSAIPPRKRRRSSAIASSRAAAAILSWVCRARSSLRFAMARPPSVRSHTMLLQGVHGPQALFGGLPACRRGQPEDAAGIHAVDHGRRNQNRGSAFLGGLVHDVHRAQLQCGGVACVDVRGLQEFLRDLLLRGAQYHAGRLLALRLGLAAHRILELGRDGDIANLDRDGGHTPVSRLAADLL